MDMYGIRGHANDLYRSYRNNKKQHAIINGVDSYLGDVKCGLPQRSVLGPLLFSLCIYVYIYISLCIYISSSGTALHTVICTRHDSFVYNEDLNTLISNIASKFRELQLRCVRNKLQINCEKITFLLFHAINKPVPRQHCYMRYDYYESKSFK